MDTIYALATAQGKAGVAVIRVSGPRAVALGESLAGSLPAPRTTAVRPLRDGQGDEIDRALVLRFEKGASFTGEDVVEFQCHGSMAVVSSVLRRISEFDGLRQAEPGEFTRRALENGRLDLAQVEGLADLIDAETEAQRRQAQRILSGELGRRAETWRRDLIRAAALLEATIDFADEEVPVDVSAEVIDLIEGVKRSLRRDIDGVGTAERIRQGFEVAIVGAPNVGKSTLLNVLAGREAAITSEYAGTTRDVIEVRMDLGGLPVTLLDTAGLRETEDHVEGIGVRKARERAGAADLRVVLREDETPLDVDLEEDDIVLFSKSDLHGKGGVSGRTGEGLDELIRRITSVLSGRAHTAGLATRERHRVAMTRACAVLQDAVDVVGAGPDSYDLAAEEVRTAIRSLDSLVGRVDVEAILDEIFASFCIGK